MAKTIQDKTVQDIKTINPMRVRSSESSTGDRTSHSGRPRASSGRGSRKVRRRTSAASSRRRPGMARRRWRSTCALRRCSGPSSNHTSTRENDTRGGLLSTTPIECIHCGKPLCPARRRAFRSADHSRIPSMRLPRGHSREKGNAHGSGAAQSAWSGRSRSEAVGPGIKPRYLHAEAPSRRWAGA